MSLIDHPTNPLSAGGSAYDDSGSPILDDAPDHGSRTWNHSRGDVVALSSHTPAIVSIVARPDSPSAWIRLVGEIDTAAMPALTNAADRLSGRPRRFIVIDLTAVTFACSTLANFLAGLHRDHPGADLVLHHPSRMVLMILAMTGLDDYVKVTGLPVGSSTRRRTGHWQAVDRQPGRTNDTGNPSVAIPEGP